ncbi:hypothetical protein BDF19DRAFT_442726 [Syncephalis fuscata]|nr:hypothetical protein BDF19DRAFT_442726 [Syncephalis fuscata]
MLIDGWMDGWIFIILVYWLLLRDNRVDAGHAWNHAIIAMLLLECESRSNISSFGYSFIVDCI